MPADANHPTPLYPLGTVGPRHRDVEDGVQAVKRCQRLLDVYGFDGMQRSVPCGQPVSVPGVPLCEDCGGPASLRGRRTCGQEKPGGPDSPMPPASAGTAPALTAVLNIIDMLVGDALEAAAEGDPRLARDLAENLIAQLQERADAWHVEALEAARGGLGS